MPDVINFKIEGLDQLEKNLLKLGAELGAKTLRGALRDSAKPMLEYMQSHAPVGTVTRTVKTKKGDTVEIRPGFLKSRIKIRANLIKSKRNVKKFGRKGVALVRVGVWGVPYVVQQEFGTSKYGGRSFIRGAESTVPLVLKIFEIRLKKRIDLAAKRLAKKKAA